MKVIQLSASVIFLLAIILLASSCNNASDTNKENNLFQTGNTDILRKVNSSAPPENSSNQNGRPATEKDTSSPVQGNTTDNMLTQAMSSMFGKNDSGMLKQLGGGKNMGSMMQKMQSMMGGKSGNPGDAMANKILNLQLGQMKDDNPLKQVAEGMRQAQENETAGPSKTYTAVYTPEQTVDYSVPVSGNGNTIMLQYTGGSITNNKKDGLWKNIYISANKANKWNVYLESYAELSAMNMKLHSTSLSGINENYSIVLNDQYKKYCKQQRSDMGKNESNVKVQKIGNEKLFGYNCVHVKISYTLKALGQTENMQDDAWYSADVPGSHFVSPLISESYSPGVVKKIMDAGCSGVLIKSISKSSGSSQVLQLSSIVQKDMPDSTFNLPANYQEDKNTSLYDIQ